MSKIVQTGVRLRSLARYSSACFLAALFFQILLDFRLGVGKGECGFGIFALDDSDDVEAELVFREYGSILLDRQPEKGLIEHAGPQAPLD